MRKVLVFVTTLDGKITKWGLSDVRSWTSNNDQQYFGKLWNESDLIVMGSGTFDVNPPALSPKHLIVVMTQRKECYKELQVAGQLEFSDEPIHDMVNRFSGDGYSQMTIIGGSQIATSFLQLQMIDEIWLTIEPRIFGTGGNFVKEVNLDIALELLHCEKVNEQGTLITKYAVLKK